MLKKFVFGALAFAAFGQAQAQQPMAPPRCDGEVQVIRISKLKPGATVADFDKVVAQHMAWYREHGYKTNVQRVGRIMTSQGFAPDQVGTIHVNAPGVPRDKQDAGWAAFVAAYRAVSEVTAQHMMCLPKM